MCSPMTSARSVGERSWSPRRRVLDERQVAVLEFADGELRSATFIYEDPQAYEAFWH